MRILRLYNLLKKSIITTFSFVKSALKMGIMREKMVCCGEVCAKKIKYR